MGRIYPLSVADLPEETRKGLAYAEEIMGFTPDNVHTMAYWPEFLDTGKHSVEAVYKPSSFDSTLKTLIASVVIGASGCRYCQANIEGSEPGELLRRNQVSDNDPGLRRLLRAAANSMASPQFHRSAVIRDNL